MTRPIVETLRRNLRQALSKGRLHDADEILERLKNEEPISRETRGFELEYFILENRFVEADDLAQQLCVLFPDSGRILYLAGKLSYRLKRYEEGASRLRESNRIYPHWSTQHWLGKTLTQTGQYGGISPACLAFALSQVFSSVGLSITHSTFLLPFAPCPLRHFLAPMEALTPISGLLPSMGIPAFTHLASVTIPSHSHPNSSDIAFLPYPSRRKN
jgi:hypothetical protein